MPWTADTTFVTADSTYATADGSGQSVQSVVAKLVNDGLIVYPDIEWVPSTLAYGTVISFNPQYGTVVQPWTVVQITVSLGFVNSVSNTTVPNLVGRQQYDAHNAISAAGLIWNVDLYAYSPTVPATYVVSQNLTAGSSVPPSTLMQITVSLGPQPSTPTVTVP